MSPRRDPLEDLGDVEDLDVGAAEEVEDDGPVPIACTRGMPGWCATSRHHRCYFTTDPDTIKSGCYGHRNEHVWICPCPCHAHNGYPPCPHPDHRNDSRPTAEQTPTITPIQINLF
jgi:hypothetical protein